MCAAMKIETPEDILRLAAMRLKAQGRPVAPGLQVDLAQLLGPPIPQPVQVHIRAAVSFGWIEPIMGQRHQLTQKGVERLSAIEEEAERGWPEQWLRRERRVRGTMWRTLLEIVTLLIAVWALIRTF